MSLTIKSFYGNGTNLGNDIAATLNSLGASATASSGTVTIQSWNNLKNVVFATSSASSSMDYTYCINDTDGKEFIFCVQTFSQTTNTYIYGFMNIDGAPFILTNVMFYQAFDYAAGMFQTTMQELEISKLLNANKTNNANTQFTNISSLNLYKPNGLVTPNVIYKDEANVEYIGLNQFMLMKRR